MVQNQYLSISPAAWPVLGAGGVGGLPEELEYRRKGKPARLQEPHLPRLFRSSIGGLPKRRCHSARNASPSSASASTKARSMSVRAMPLAFNASAILLRL